MRALVARTLRRGGFDVVEASNGYETIERLSDALYSTPVTGLDLIISDVRMPGYDGFNILASLKGLLASIPVILMTGFPNSATHATAGRLGAYAMLEKPFELEDLMALARLATDSDLGKKGEPS